LKCSKNGVRQWLQALGRALERQGMVDSGTRWAPAGADTLFQSCSALIKVQFVRFYDEGEIFISNKHIKK
jgi:hypothetical protein